MVGGNSFTLYHWPRGYMSMKGRYEPNQIRPYVLKAELSA